MSGDKVMMGLQEAIDFANGVAPAPRIWLNGHWYVPEQEAKQQSEWARDRVVLRMRSLLLSLGIFGIIRKSPILDKWLADEIRSEW